MFLRAKSLFTLSAIAAVALLAACSSSSTPESTTNTNASNPNVPASSAPAEPPYKSKEPPRYQATIVMTTDQPNKNSVLALLPSLMNREMTIARDGDRRRVDYEVVPGAKVVMLQLGATRYLIVPSKKMYADVSSTNANDTAPSFGTIGPDFTADKLLSETRPGAQYEKLGTETMNGRETTKYRATAKLGREGQTDVTSESMIWFDEQFGMPVRAETTTKGGSSDGTKFTMEMRDIRTEVDPRVFDLPKGYSKIAARDIFTQAMPNMPAAPPQMTAPKNANRK